MNKSGLMSKLWELLEMRGGNRQVMVARVAKEMGVACPTLKLDQWDLLREYVYRRTGKKSLAADYVPKPHVRLSKAKKAKKGKTRRYPQEGFGDPFLASYEWRKLRMEVLSERGARCECCGARPAKDNDVVLNVDHVQPRKLRSDLSLDKRNLQILCHTCNHGKGNWNQTDWRPEMQSKDTIN